MQTDRHHFGGPPAFGPEHVEGIPQIREELIAVTEALRIDEAHVIGIERIGDDQMRLLGSAHPIGQIVGIGIRGIEKAALVQNGLQGIDRISPRVPAERALAGCFGVDANRLGELSALVRLGHVLVIDPFETMAGDFPLRLAHGRNGLRISRQRGRDGENRHRHLSLGENAPKPPETCPRPIFVHGFHIQVALPGPGLRAENIGEECLRRGVTMERVTLPALLVVHHELHADARASRPARVGRIAAIAYEVARIPGGARLRRHVVTLRARRPRSRRR